MPYGDPPVTEQPDDRSPLARATQWSVSTMTIAVEMVVPILLGPGSTDDWERKAYSRSSAEPSAWRPVSGHCFDWSSHFGMTVSERRTGKSTPTSRLHSRLHDHEHRILDL